MDLSVIIVNYNVKYFLEQCLYAVLKACAPIEAEVLVIDNNSTDGSKEYLPGKFPGVSFTWQEENTGFAKANNLALKEARGAYVLFLNPDTIVAEDCFEKCLAFFKAHADAGALGVRMIDGSGEFLRESKRSFPTASASFFKLAGFSRLFPTSKLFAAYYAGHLPEMKTQEVDVLAGAFMMLNRKSLQSTNGFDEDYFMYGEDIDLSYRVQQAGFKNYYFADTSIIHFKGESTQKKSFKYVRLFYVAMHLFVNKHYKDHKLTYFLMHFAIAGGRMLANLAALLRKTRPGNRKASRIMNVAVLAGQQRFEEMIRLMKHSAKPILFRGRIAPGDTARGIHLGTEQDLPRLVKKYDIDELVLCEGELSFKTIIEKIQAYKGLTGFLFHASASSSVVGSISKNEQGFFIAKD